MKKLFLAVFLAISCIWLSAQNQKWTMENIPMSFHSDNGPIDPQFTLLCCKLHEKGTNGNCMEGGVCYCRVFAPCDDPIIGREDVPFDFNAQAVEANNRFVNVYFRENPVNIPLADRKFNVNFRVDLLDGYYFEVGQYTFDPSVGIYGGFKIKVNRD